MFAFSDQEWPGIAKLIEECGELGELLGPALLLTAIGRLVKSNGKLMMVHGRRDHWSGDLRQALIEEIADVDAASDFVKEHCFSKGERTKMANRRKSKLKKFEKWDATGTVRSRKKKVTPKAKSTTKRASSRTKRSS